MSIKPINSADSNASFKKKIEVSTGAGFCAGLAVSAARKNWLYKGMPSDTFIKSVGKKLEKNMTSEELKEASRINTFLQSVVDPEVKLETLKPQIRHSKELSEAIKSTPDENVEAAISRVFSNPDKAKVKQDLLDLQYNTHSDKIANRNTSLKLIHDNFDAKKKALVKSPNTKDAVFNTIKNTALKLQVKSALVGGLVASFAAGAVCLIATDLPGEKKK